jgi:hypothetical protein
VLDGADVQRVTAEMYAAMPRHGAAWLQPADAAPPHAHLAHLSGLALDQRLTFGAAAGAGCAGGASGASCLCSCACSSVVDAF